MVRRLMLSCVCCALFLGCPSKKTPVEPKGTTTEVNEPDDPPPKKEVKAGGAPRCEGPRECVLGPSACCPACEDHGLDQLKVWRRDEHQKAYEACLKKKVKCNQCKADVGQDTNLVALCRDKRCVGLDLRQSRYSECEKDDQCRLHGTGCCSCNSWAMPVALSTERSKEFKKANCGNMHCGACRRRIFYKGLKAVCKDGHCAVTGTWNKEAEGIPAP